MSWRRFRWPSNFGIFEVSIGLIYRTTEEP